MGYPTQQQKVDYLFKKLGFAKSKTGIAEDQSKSGGFSGDTDKSPPNEAIASPLVVPASSIWADSSSIPASPPGSDSTYVEGYRTANAFRMTVDTTVSNNKAFIARETWGNPSSTIKGDWIDTQFGADYIVQVYKGDPNSGGTQIYSDGTSGNDDTWFFDYSSGVLNFNGIDDVSGITTSNVYIIAYRYTGTKGSQPPGGIGTFNNLYVSGIATVAGLLDANGGLTANTAIVEDLTNNRVVIAGTGGELEDDANLTFDGSTLAVGVGLNVTGKSTLTKEVGISSALSVAGVSTFVGIASFSALVDFDGGIAATTAKVEDLTSGRVTYAGAGGELQDSGNLTFDGTDLTAASAKISDLTDNRVVIAGTSGALEDSGNLTFDGTTLGLTGNQTISENLNVTGVSTFAGVSTFSSTVLAQKSVQVAENLNVTGITTLGSIGISTGRITGPAITYIDPAAVGDNTGLLIIKGNLQVDGTQTTVNSTTMTVTDKNVELAKGAANDAAADGAGITVDSGDGDKTLNWVDSTDAWTSSEHFDLAAGKSYDIAGTEIIHSLRATLGGTLSVAGVTTVKQLEIGTLGQTLVGITTILDEDNMASNSAAALATQQSIKAYVDTQVTAQDLDFAGDSGTGAVDLDSQSLTLAGTSNEIETSASGQTITLGLPNDVTIGNDLTVTGDIASVTNLNVTGVSTFTGISTFSSTLLTQKSVQIEENLNVSGLSTFVGDVKVQADVYSDQIRRYTDSGTTTKINLQDEDIRLFAGHTTQYVLGVTPTQVTIANSGHLNVTGVSTFTGISTFSSTLLTQKSVQIEENLNITGVSTFTGAIDANSDLDVDGFTELDDLNVSGITTTVTLNVGTSGQSLVGITTILDEDNMASDSATALATQQSIKKYVDDQVTAQDLDFQADTGGALNIDLDSEVLSVVGTANEIETAGSGNQIQIGLPNNVTIGNDLTVTGDIASVTNLNVSGITTTVSFSVGTTGQTLVGITTILDEDNMASNSATALVTQQSVKAYVDSQVTAQDLDVTSDSGTIAIDLDSETLSISGTSNEIETSATGNAVTIGLPDDVTIGNNLTVTNKSTLTKEVGISSALSVAGVSTFVGITSFTSLADFDGGIAATTAKVEDLTEDRVVIAGAGGELEDSGNLTFDGSTLLVTGTLNSTVDVQINGTSVADSALNDAVAMAIALG